MKNLLSISWCFPPTIYPRSIQVSRLLAALTDRDWQSDVVCVEPSSLRPGLILDETLNRPANGLVKKFQVPSLEDWKLVRGLIRLIPPLGVLPDPKWVWKNAALRRCTRLTANKKYAAFISFGQPWTDHLVGLQLKEQTGLPWAAHFSDPWADTEYVDASTWVLKKRLEMETSVIHQADAVIFVSQQTADLVMKKYPEGLQKKVHVIPHGFETIPPSEDQAAASSNTPLKLVYTGGFYGHRTPDPIIEAARKVQKTAGYENSFQIRFIGPIPQNILSDLDLLAEQNIHFEGPATHAGSQLACQEADVLLVIDAPSNTPSVYLPSKLVDYLAFDKPILGITPLDGASADLIIRLGCSVNEPEDVTGIATRIRALVDTKRAGKLSLPTEFKAIAAKYHIHNAAVKLDKILQEITA